MKIIVPGGPLGPGNPAGPKYHRFHLGLLQNTVKLSYLVGQVNIFGMVLKEQIFMRCEMMNSKCNEISCSAGLQL